MSDPKMLIEFAKAMNHLAAEIHEGCVKKGFWEHSNNQLLIPTKLMLIVSEVAEGMEAHRSNLTDEHLPGHNPVVLELADVVIRCMDLAASMELSLGQYIVDKHVYNQGRPFKHGGKRY